jgi:hypothetical protein
MLKVYLSKMSSCWTVVLEGVSPLRSMPTHTLLPLPLAADVPWTAVAAYAHRVFPGATVYYRGSQV